MTASARIAVSSIASERVSPASPQRIEHSYRIDDSVNIDGPLLEWMSAPARRRWSALNAQLDRLRAMYADRIVSESAALERGVSVFFKDCWDVKDWLKRDHGLPTQVGAEVERYAFENAPLRLGGAVGHGDGAPSLSGVNAIQARCFRVHGTNTAVVVSYWSQARWRQTIDALDLAERCHLAWRSILL